MRKAFISVTFVVDIPDEIDIDEVVAETGVDGILQFGTMDENFEFTMFSDLTKVKAHCTDTVEIADENGECKEVAWVWLQ